MYLVSEFCKDVKNSAFGGSAEMVFNGIKAFSNQLESDRYENAAQLREKLISYLDDALEVSGSVLPQINFIIKTNALAEAVDDGEDVDAVRKRCLDYFKSVEESQKSSLHNIGAIGARMAPQKAKISTFSTSGTVEEIYRQAVEMGKDVSAACFEARPHCEGKRTFKTLCGFGVKTSFGVDALLYKLIPGSDYFVIGADAVRATGEVYAKTGSYMAALVCREFGIPFYVAADTSKFDAMSVLGYPLKDSSRPWPESYDGELPENGTVYNISFELIPPSLVAGIITEKGLVTPQAFPMAASGGEISASMQAKLDAWLKRSRF